MKTKTIFCFLIIFTVINAHAQQGGPVAVSPGSDEGIAKVGESCPTFSWTAVDWAAGYKVVVFETSGPHVLAFNEMEAIASPVLTKEIHGRALSWTPSSDEWLGIGGTYVWYVQATDESGTTMWSKGRAFKVEIIDRFAKIGETLSRTLREYGVDEGVIAKVLEETAFELEGVEPGFSATGDDISLPIGIQGNETGSNTYYGEGTGASLTSGINNSFFGYDAGNKTDTGVYNTFVGAFAGEDNSYGESNTFVGTLAGYKNLASNNTYIGENAGAYHVLGNYNTAIGKSAGYNHNGEYNIFIGNVAGGNNDADNNIFIGYRSGLNNLADNNTFIGYYSGNANTTGAQNTYIGHQSGKTNETGLNNTFIGYQAGMNATSSHNTFLGRSTGESNTTGNSNTFLGHSAGYLNTTGQSGTYVGRAAGYNNEEGNNNTFVGYFSGYNNEGSYNTLIGRSAGYTNSTGEGNTFLGCNAGYNETGSHKLYIDNSSTNSPLIWGDFLNDILTVHGKLGVGTQSPAYQVEIETTGENAILLLDRTDGAKTGFSASGDKCAFGTLTNHPLWMVINGAFSAIFHTDGSLQMMNGAWCTAAGKWQDASSRELKENIQSLTVEDAKEALEGLDPVRFNYKADKDDESLGFIAEDVPELVASKDRKSMSPMDVVAVLTKVVQEQQRMAEEQQNTIAELRKQIEELKNEGK